MRVLKTIRYLGPLRELVGVISHTLPSLLWIVLLIVLFMFVFSVLGMQFFGTTDESRVLCEDFNTFAMAVLTMFKLLTEEDAFARYTYPCLLATSSLAVIFFIAWILIAVFVLLDLINDRPQDAKFTKLLKKSREASAH